MVNLELGISEMEEYATVLRHYAFAAVAAAGGAVPKTSFASSKGAGKGGRQVQISKALTQVLRHSAVKLSLPIRPDGYIELNAVLQCSLLKKFVSTPEEVEEIVRSSDKQRFAMAEIDGSWHIRASQGHSMKVVQDDLLLEPLRKDMEDLPEVLHGTYSRHWKSIQEKGLLAGGNQGQKFRNHVHFATGLPSSGDVISGMRQTCDIAIYLDVVKALEAGLPLYRSANNVLLSPGFDGVVPPHLFLKVVRVKDGTLVWSADAE